MLFRDSCARSFSAKVNVVFYSWLHCIYFTVFNICTQYPMPDASKLLFYANRPYFLKFCKHFYYILIKCPIITISIKCYCNFKYQKINLSSKMFPTIHLPYLLSRMLQPSSALILSYYQLRWLLTYRTTENYAFALAFYITTCYRHIRFKSLYGPAIQVQTLNGLMETVSLGCK